MKTSRRNDSLEWAVLVGIDNAYQNDNSLARKELIDSILSNNFYEFTKEEIEEKIDDLFLKNYLTLFKKGNVYCLKLTVLGYFYLSGKEVENDLYFDASMEDNYTWLDFWQYLVDLNTNTNNEITTKMISEIRNDTKRIIEKYRR